MKPFLAAVVVMIAISVGANAYLTSLPLGAADAGSSASNVRLDTE